MNIDKRHKYGIMIDTETANGLDCPLCYDVGWQVIDSHGRLYAERSFLVREVFVHERSLMTSCYYANKIPSYVEDVRKGKRVIKDLYEIKALLAQDVKDFNCKFICAHNARFDYKSLHTTQRYYTKSKYRWFVPFGLEWWDTMKMAQDVIIKMPTYQKWCTENNGLNSQGKPSRSAENLFRFISKNPAFIEEHKGLDDVNIERQILAYCVRQKKKMNKRLWND